MGSDYNNNIEWMQSISFDQLFTEMRGTRPKKIVQKKQYPSGIKCDLCNIILSNKEYFRRHLKTKNHKKSIKKNKSIKADTILQIGNENIIKEKFKVQSLAETLNESSLGIADIHQPEEIFTRKKYTVGSDSLAFDLHKSYIYSTVSYLSLRLALDQNTIDFSISVNDNRWQTFGDIVINLVYKGKRTIYAIRCKSVSDTPQTIDSFKDAKIVLEKEYLAIHSFKKEKRNSKKIDNFLADLNITKFLIFTTCITTSKFPETVELNLNKIKLKKNDNEDNLPDSFTVKVIPISKKNDILNMSSENENRFGVNPDKDLNLPPIYLYTDQKSHPQMVNYLIRKQFAVDRDIFKSYENYIEKWVEGKLGGNYVLTKNDVVLKLGQLLLEPYASLPKMVNLKSGCFKMWNKVVEKTDVIIVKSEPYVLSKLCEPFNHMIEESLSLNIQQKVTIDPITKTVNITNDLINTIKDAKIKAYLFEEDFEIGKTEMHISNLYNVFWKAGKIPLLISLEKNEDSKNFLLNVISYMKERGVQKKFMIKSDTPFLDKSIPKNLKVFSRLEDVEQFVDLDKIKIRVTKDYGLSLGEISKSDPFILKWVTPNIFYDMISERISMLSLESLKTNVECNLKIILNDTTKEYLRGILFGKNDLPESFGRLTGIDPTLI